MCQIAGIRVLLTSVSLLAMNAASTFSESGTNAHRQEVAVGPVELAEEVPIEFVFSNAPVRVTMDLYTNLARSKVIISSDVMKVPHGITARATGSRVEVIKEFENALLAQAGVVFTLLSSNRVSVTYNDAIEIQSAVGIPSRDRAESNNPASGKTGITFPLIIQPHRPGLPEPGRCPLHAQDINMSKTNYWDQIEKAFEAVDIYETYDIFKQGAAKYPEWQIDILAVHWTMSEVANGGLEQYFGNSTGILAPEAVLGFQRIGKPELAAALQRAMVLLGEPYPCERMERGERLAALSGNEEAQAREGFSLVPKWVAKKVGMTSAQSPFEEMDEVLGGAGDDVEEALDEYAGTKVG